MYLRGVGGAIRRSHLCCVHSPYLHVSRPVCFAERDARGRPGVCCHAVHLEELLSRHPSGALPFPAIPVPSPARPRPLVPLVQLRDFAFVSRRLGEVQRAAE